MSYRYDLPDFKRYLNDLSKRNRIDGLIFWQNRIPLPIDLFNRFFNESDYFVGLYVDHLSVAVTILASNSSVLETTGLDFKHFPTNEVNKNREIFSSLVHESLQHSKEVQNTSDEVAESLGLEDYELSVDKLFSALTHKGKKYTRLYCPEPIKKIVVHSFPNAFLDIGFDNTDMFGNVIADHYDMYRAGFGDALSYLFNKLLDYRLLCEGAVVGLKTVPARLDISKTEQNILEQRTSDGSLWEPYMLDQHTLRLNPEHPFFVKLNGSDSSSQKAAVEILYSLSEFESQQFSDSQKKLIENMRQEVSRELWIKYES